MMSLFISHVWKRFGSRLPQKSPFWITHRALQANTVDSWIYGDRIRFWLAKKQVPVIFFCSPNDREIIEVHFKTKNTIELEFKSLREQEHCLFLHIAWGAPETLFWKIENLVT